MPTSVRILALVAALVLAACGDGDGGEGGGGAVSPPAADSCPEATSLEVTTADDGTFTLDAASEFVLRIEDDSLYGDYWSAAWADFDLETSTSVTTEGAQRAVVIEVYNRDQTLPATGTFDFEGQQNTFFQPSFHTGGTSQPVTTLGDGGTLTLTVANEQELCGSIDVSDGSVTIQGVFRAPVTPRD